ncbi:MAG: uracil phosphoribosyltransferase [Planctomycetota bacterium]
MTGGLNAFLPSTAFLRVTTMAHAESGSVTVLQHPLGQHHLSGLRAAETPPALFRFHAEVLAGLLATEVTRDLPLTEADLRTPLEVTVGRRLSARVVLVPILRAGLGMTAPFLQLIPEIEVRHLGIRRDEETAMPVSYYDRLPGHSPPEIAIIVDPMLATGGSAVHAAASLAAWGVTDIRLVCLLAAPEGILRVQQEFPGVRIFTAVIDRQLNSRSYILPGLGDAGDRIFNTL